MLAVGKGLALGSALLATLLATLGTTVGLGAFGWGAGLACGVVIGVAVSRADVEALGPADLVTLTRAALACALAALVTESFLHEPASATIVGLAVVALATDAVDGRVARSTGTTSRFGARLDGEVDAFLILVLSVYVAAEVQAWVLAAAGWIWPWMRAQLPPRYWRKVVTAVQGIALTGAAAAVLPGWLTMVALVAAAALLAESFGRDVVWLWRRRPAGRERRASGALVRLHLPRP
jgi:phosphatidylglycerophosphate synthase